MTKYELLYIVSSQYTDVEIAEIQNKVKGLLEGEGLKITRNESLGKIRFAYPIKSVRHGTYILVHFEADSTPISTLDRKLSLTDEILRHQIVLMPKGAEKKKYEITSYVAPLSEEAREAKREPTSQSKTISTPAPTETPEIAPPPPALVQDSEMTIEELDKKLDSILEDDVSKT